jgi:hypothetical protein
LLGETCTNNWWVYVSVIELFFYSH